MARMNLGNSLIEPTTHKQLSSKSLSICFFEAKL